MDTSSTTNTPDPGDVIAALTSQRDMALQQAVLWECEAQRLNRENIAMRDLLASQKETDA